jgi:hypothetical protein
MFFFQSVQQFLHGALLSRRAGVGRLSLGIQSALVAHAQRVLVVAAGVGTYELFVARLVDGAVAGDIIVVAGESEPIPVVAYQLHHRVPPVAARRTAVNHNQIYFSHSQNLERHAALHAQARQYGSENSHHHLDNGFDSILVHFF